MKVSIVHMTTAEFHVSPFLLSARRLIGRPCAQIGGFVGDPDEKEFPQRNDDACLFRARRQRLLSALSVFRHGCLAVAAVIFFNVQAIAVEPSEQLGNPVLEARAREISGGLRCLVCQNETIDESNASLAHDIRILLRERLTAGDTDEQAVKAIVDRYGEFVLLDPPVHPATYVLWFGPFAILLGGLLGGVVWLRRRSGSTEPTMPLTPDERRRLDIILREADR